MLLLLRRRHACSFVQVDIFSEDEPNVELVSPEAIPRLRILGETMLDGGHDGCTRVYVEIRSQAVEKIFNDLGLREYNGVYLQVLFSSIG